MTNKYQEFENLGPDLQQMLGAMATIMTQVGICEIVLSKDEEGDINFSITPDNVPKGVVLQ